MDVDEDLERGPISALRLLPVPASELHLEAGLDEVSAHSLSRTLTADNLADINPALTRRSDEASPLTGR